MLQNRKVIHPDAGRWEGYGFTPHVTIVPNAIGKDRIEELNLTTITFDRLCLWQYEANAQGKTLSALQIAEKTLCK